jgi:hypothetical protein
MSGHGTRARYFGGCRCEGCRRANARYQRERKARARTGAPGFVDAAGSGVRAHLLRLSRKGVGRRAVADACGLDAHTVWAIRRGKRLRICATTAARILAVDAGARADHARVSAAGPRRIVERLVDYGYTKLFLARQLGYRGAGLPFCYSGPMVSARTASRVERLERLIEQGRVSR